MSPKMGRPPIDNPKDSSIHIRVTTAEKKEIKDFATKNGLTILDLIRKGINAVKKEIANCPRYQR